MSFVEKFITILTVSQFRLDVATAFALVFSNRDFDIINIAAKMMAARIGTHLYLTMRTKRHFRHLLSCKGRFDLILGVSAQMSTDTENDCLLAAVGLVYFLGFD